MAFIYAMFYKVHAPYFSFLLWFLGKVSRMHIVSSMVLFTNKKMDTIFNKFFYKKKPESLLLILSLLLSYFFCPKFRALH
jgi:hypothetical protein